MSRSGKERLEEGVRTDIARRLRTALAKLNDRLLEAEIALLRTRGGEAYESAASSHTKLTMHVHDLRWALAWFVVHGSLHLSSGAEEALEEAEKAQKRAPAKPVAEKPRRAPPVVARIKSADVPEARRLLAGLNEGPKATVRIRALSFEAEGDVGELPGIARQLLLGEGGRGR